MLECKSKNASDVVVIRADGISLVLTVNHLLPEDDATALVNHLEPPIDAKTLGKSEPNDLMLLFIPRRLDFALPLPPANSPNVKQDDHVKLLYWAQRQITCI